MAQTAPLAMSRALLGLGAIAAWTQALITEWPRLTAFGPICSEASGFLGLGGHCPACYVAAALSVGFLLSFVPQPRAQTQKARA